MSRDNREPFRAESAITRRQLLRRFSAVGGASMVMGAMGAWDLMAAPAGPRPVLGGTPPADTRVLVLGAGMSGLVTGYELGKLGYDYRILEARDRVGGLNWTVKRGAEHTELGTGEHQVCRFDEGQYVNAGPWRIPHSHHGVIGYCKELGVRLEEFNDENTVLFGEDPALGPLTGKKIRLQELRADLWGNTSELLAKAANQGSLDTAISADDRELLVEFLVRAGYLDSSDQLYHADAAIRGSEDAYDLGALLRSPFAAQVRSVYSGTGGPAPVFQPTGGMMQIPLGFERAIGDQITRGVEVESIHQTEDGVRVVYKELRSGAKQEISADYVVCCLPMSILKTLDVNFSPDMATAVNETNHASQAKMGLQMKRRFWEEDDDIYGGHLVYISSVPSEDDPEGRRSGNPLPQFSYPSNDYASQKGVLLGYYGNAQLPGLDGVPLLDSTVGNRIEYVLAHASNVHPQIRAEFDSAYAVWWDKVPYSRGAWASNPGPRLEQLSKADGRLYIGSAAASPDPAWMEGAVESAWRTVESLHRRVMAEA